jgi:LacI family transcriptional regulator
VPWDKWKGDGIIAHASLSILQEHLRKAGVPIVNISARDREMPYPTVLPDNTAIGRLAADHFLGRGFKNYAFCGFKDHYYSELRFEGFAEDIGKQGFTCSQYVDMVSEHEPIAIQKWVRELPKPVAVLACNDVRARHVADACLAENIRVPEEVAILGVDNDALQCEIASPLLSSVDIGMENIGYEAAALLDRLMSGKKPSPKPILVPPKGVVVRESSDSLAVADPDVADAMRFIRNNAGSPIRASDVVAAVPLSRRVLERRFRQVLNCTIWEQIARAHIDRAKTLLVETDMSAPEIAQACGCNYVQQFNRLFKAQTSTTPRQYRLMRRTR